jgi:hypothetical protein
MVLDSTMDGIGLTLEAIQELERLVPDQADALDDLKEAKKAAKSGEKAAGFYFGLGIDF